MGLLKPIRDYIETLVHPSVQHNALAAARHRAFIAPRLLGCVIALAALPVYMVMRGAPGPVEALIFGWLVAPILLAYYLSRTGRYESAHTLSSLALTGLVTAVAAVTGGISSFAAIWLVVVPLEAALSASRRVVATASSFALGAAALLLLLGGVDLLPAPVAPGNQAGALAALGIISAALYATGIALGAETLARTSLWLLYAEEDRYRLLARNMTDVITRHGRNGEVLFVSPAAQTLFGVPVSELTGHKLFDRVHVADRPAYLTALADAATLGEVRTVEFRVRSDAPRGKSAATCETVQFVWVEMRCRPLESWGQAAASQERDVVAVTRDVSDRKAQERTLEAMRAEAETAHAAKSRFLATMSHELRTPLNAIIGFSEMLAQEDKIPMDAARRHDYARLIHESGTHLLSVVNGILDMSKMDAGDFEIAPEPFSPGPVIEGCCDLLALKAREADIDLAMRLPADLPDIVADKRAFKQILINLISNAVKFTDRCGSVSIAAGVEGNVFSISVQDNGVGIGPDDLPKLGNPFFQARAAYDRRHDGTGLGLSIVKGLVMLHGGTIDIASRLGEGTCVTVRIPVDREGVRPTSETPPVVRPAFDRSAFAAGEPVFELPQQVKKRA